MDLTRKIILALTITVMVAIVVAPCFAANENKENIWGDQDQPREPRRGGERDRGPSGRDQRREQRRDQQGREGRGPGGDRRDRKFEITDEEIEKTLKGLRENYPERAKELVAMREKDPEKFKAEIGKHVFERRFEWLRRRWRQEFIAWLERVVPRDASELASLKDSDPNLYTQKYDIVERKYGRFFERGRRDPEIATIIETDLQLDQRQDVLLGKIKAAKDEDEKKQFTAQLEEVVSAKYDLIIKQKEIEYERLLRRLRELQEEINKSKDEITRWKDAKVRTPNIEERVKYLLEKRERERTPRFRW